MNPLSKRRAGNLVVRGLLPLTLSAGLLGAFSACGEEPVTVVVGSGTTNGGPSGDICATPRECCACEGAGKVVGCGKIQQSVGDTLYCSQGKTTCSDGKWGACSADVNFVRSKYSLSPLGLGSPGACVSNLCDPGCTAIKDTPVGLTFDAGDGGPNLEVKDGGLQIKPTEKPPGQGCTGLAPMADQNIVVTNLSPLQTTPANLLFETALVPADCASVTPIWGTTGFDRSYIEPTLADPSKAIFSQVLPLPGPVQVNAYAGQFTAGATVNVTVLAREKDPRVAGGITDTSFVGATTSTRAAVVALYPYADTLFPLGLTAPRVMWKRDAADSPSGAVRVSLKNASGTFIWSLITPEPNTGDFATRPFLQIPQARWAAFEQATKGGAGLIEIHRLDGAGNRQAPITIPISFTNANLRGRIYYTAYTFNGGEAGGVVSIKPSGNEAPIIVTPRVDAAGVPVLDGSGNRISNCGVCHSMSASGNRFVTSNWESAGGTGNQAFGVASVQSDGLLSPLSTTTPNNNGDSRGFAYMPITPDGKYVIQTTTWWGSAYEPNRSKLFELQNTRGAPTDVTATGGQDKQWGLSTTDMAAMTFSPDGTRLAFVDYDDSGRAASRRGVSTMRFDQAGKRFYDRSSRLVTGAAAAAPYATAAGDVAPWKSADIRNSGGTTVRTGSGATEVIRLTAGNGDIWDVRDAFRFRYLRVTGDGSITAKVDSFTSTNYWSKAGVMIRADESASSVNFASLLTGGSGIVSQNRSEAGGQPYTAMFPTASNGRTAPYWLRVTRAGLNVTAAMSVNGTTWVTLITTTSTKLPPTMLFGLALARNGGSSPTVAFSNISVTGTVDTTAVDADLEPGFLANKVVRWPTYESDSRSLIVQTSDSTDDSSAYGGMLPSGCCDKYSYRVHGKLYSFDTYSNNPSAVALDKLNVGLGSPSPLGTDDRNRNYQPTMLPAPVGGKRWLVMSSGRAYGNYVNTLPRGEVGQDSSNADPEDPRTLSKAIGKLWVAAINDGVSAGADRSYAPFFLPNQNLTDAVINERAYWALDQCKASLVGAPPAIPPPGPLPDLSWLSRDIRSTPGTTTVKDSSVVLTASGDDIWGTQDGMRMRYKRVTGNGTITARVASMTTPDGWTKAGVMLRNSLDAGSVHGFGMAAKGQGYVDMQWRDTTNGGSNWGGGNVLPVPQWVRLTRSGTTVTFLTSPDGLVWTTVRTRTLTNLTTALYAGIALTAHNAGLTATAQFDNVSITGFTAVPYDATDSTSSADVYEPTPPVVVDPSACESNDECCGYNATTPALSTASCTIDLPVTTNPPRRHCRPVLPAGVCRAKGDVCGVDADCCNPDKNFCKSGICDARPPILYFNQPEVFTRDFELSCPPQKAGKWTFFEWQDTIPMGTKIDFAIRTADVATDLPTSVPLLGFPPGGATVSTPTTPVGTFDSYDTGAGLGPLASKRKFARVTMKLYPSVDGKFTPVLWQWRQLFTCVDNE
jgi:regulation of enolase protein 1 (concanavalin A-like superfamily)